MATTAMFLAGCGGKAAPNDTSHDAAADDVDAAVSDAAEASSELPDATPADAPLDVPVDVGSSSYFDAYPVTCPVMTSPSNACALITQDFPWGGGGNWVTGAACGALCNNACPGDNPVPGDPTWWHCVIDPNYFDAYRALLEAGAPDGDADVGSCPTWSSQVLIQCDSPPIGRRTAQTTEPMPRRTSRSVGRELAERAYLEALSVHSFATLERELVAHAAPPSLLRDVRRARRDEVRHAAMTEKLARRFGGTLRHFAAPPPAPVRGLLAMALENAVEGCVRETYGAVVGLVEARMSADRRVRRAMRSIAADECRHAELAWAVGSWLRLRLGADERALVDRAARDAIEELRRDAQPHILSELERRVWRQETRAAA